MLRWLKILQVEERQNLVANIDPIFPFDKSSLNSLLGYLLYCIVNIHVSHLSLSYPFGWFTCQFHASLMISLIDVRFGSQPRTRSEERRVGIEWRARLWWEE